MPRSGDGHVVFEELNGPETDLLSVPFPGETTPPTVAPAPITTAAPERMPAWSPDGLPLGFVRTAARRPRSASSTSRRACRRSSTRSSTSA